MQDSYNYMFEVFIKAPALFLYEQAGTFFVSSFFMDFVSIYKIVAIGFSIFIFTLIVMVIRKDKRLKGSQVEKSEEDPAIKMEVERKSKANVQWIEVIRKSNSENESDWKLAIIDADKILDNILKIMGYEGESMGDRLKQMDRGQFPNLDDIWKVHKVRNNIVHDSEYKIYKKDADFTITVYEKALRELKVL